MAEQVLRRNYPAHLTQKMAPTPKELSFLSHDELLPLLSQNIGISMEAFRRQPKVEDGKYPLNTLAGIIVVHVLDSYAEQLYEQSSRSTLMRNLRNFLLAYCPDKSDGGFCVEKLSSWLERTYYQYITEALNNLTKILTPLTFPIAESMNTERISFLGQFKQLLYSVNIDVDEKVIEIITSQFASRALLADSPTSASNLYYLVSNLPSTRTKSIIEKEFGIKLNGVFDPNISDYIISATYLGKPILVKMLIGPDMEYEIISVNLLNESTTCPMLVPTKVCSVKLDERNRHGRRIFHSLIMPHYPCSLDKMVGLLNDEYIVRGGHRMLEALQFIHSRNMVHMDVKPANIFVSTEGEWFLGDFGSCVVHQNEIHSCSECYLPKKVIGERAEYGYDYFMLAISLLSLKFELKLMLLKNEKLIDENKVKEIVSNLQNNELQVFIQDLLDKSRTAFETNNILLN